MGNSAQKDASHNEPPEDPWWLGCGTGDCRDFGEVCSNSDSRKNRREQTHGQSMAFVNLQGEGGDRIRPFENSRVAAMPGPQPPSFVYGGGEPTADGYHDEAADRYAAGDFDTAEDLYQKALRSNPRHLRSLCNYGALLQNVRQDFQRAEQMYLKALEVDDRDAIALYNYGLLLENAKQDPLGAEAMYKRALAADPNNVDTLCNYGALIKTVHNDYATAEKMYQTALAAAPNHVDTLCNYALLLRDCLDNTPKARQLIQRAQELAPDDEWLRLYAKNF